MATLSEEVEMLRKIPLFSAIDPGKLKLLAFASDRKVYKSGQDLFKQGEVGDAAYVIVDGMADVIVETDAGEVVVAQLGANEFIGEISILCDVPRTATVRASEELQTLKIKKEHFLGLVTQVPDLGIEVMRELASRLSKTTAELGEARRELSTAKSC
ncbi:MAG: cyclic nucleotide-binding domain-containing protein [Pseudomonadota bacterium]